MFSIKKYFIPFCALLALLTNYSEARADEGDKLLANFVYNLVDYIKWKESSNVNICSYGYDEVSSNLAKIDTSLLTSTDRLYSIEQVTILNHVDFDDISSCNLLYISKDQEKDLLKIIDKTKEKPLITISNIENFVDYGGILEFKLSRRKVKLKLGDEMLKKSGIKLSPVILMSVGPNINQSIHSAQK